MAEGVSGKQKRFREGTPEAEKTITIMDIDADDERKWEEMEEKALMIELMKNIRSNSRKMDTIMQRLDKGDSWRANMEVTLTDYNDRISHLENKIEEMGIRAEEVGPTSSNDFRNNDGNKEWFALKSKISELENRNRKNNVICKGIPEKSDKETEEEIECTINKLVEEKLNIMGVKFEKLYRIGKGRQGQSRLILGKLIFLKDKERIMKESKKLKGSDIFIFEDFSEETRRNRKLLLDFAHEQKKNNAESRFVLIADKLKLDGKFFMVDCDGKVKEKINKA